MMNDELIEKVAEQGYVAFEASAIVNRWASSNRSGAPWSLVPEHIKAAHRSFARAAMQAVREAGWTAPVSDPIGDIRKKAQDMMPAVFKSQSLKNKIAGVE